MKSLPTFPWHVIYMYRKAGSILFLNLLSFLVGSTGLFCAYVLFGWSVESLRDETSWNDPSWPFCWRWHCSGNCNCNLSWHWPRDIISYLWGLIFYLVDVWHLHWSSSAILTEKVSPKGTSWISVSLQWVVSPKYGEYQIVVYWEILRLL